LSVNEVLEDAEARQRERPRFHPHRDGAVAASDLSPPARVEIVGRSETRPERISAKAAPASPASIGRIDGPALTPLPAALRGSAGSAARPRGDSSG
jgi:hypothetical protein